MRLRSTAARALFVLALLRASAARGELQLTLEPIYTAGTTDTRGAGVATHTAVNALLQRYRFNWDQAIYPSLTVSAGGNLDWSKGTQTTDGVTSDQDSKNWNGYGRLSLGDQILGGGLTYTRTAQESSSTTQGVRTTAPTLVREALAANVAWRPSELPALSLRLSRTNEFDTPRTSTDLKTTEVDASAVYRPTRQLDTDYSLRYTDADDAIHNLRQRDLINAARVTWSDRLLDNRLQYYTSYSISNRQSATDAFGSGGTVTTQQFPTAGLAAIENFPATPDKVTLTPKPTLVDSDLTLGVGIDIGFGPSLAGDRAYRDLGAQFGAFATVNQIYVYVDQRLPANVASGFTWTAWASSDNITWSPVAVVGTVLFSALQNRFEIPVARTDGARYLKVTTQPLLPSVTSDRTYAAIAVTEIQFGLVEAADEAHRRTSLTSGQLTATARYLIERSMNLSFDTAFYLAHTSNPARQTWSVQNGLSASRRLSSTVGVNGRIDRTDSNQGQGHDSVSRGSAGLTYDPLPTLGAGVTYSAQLSQTQRGRLWSNGLTGFTRADLYEGFAVSSTSTATFGMNELDQSTRGLTWAANTSIIPNKIVTLAGTFGLTVSQLSGGGQPFRSDRSSLVSGSLTITPFPALFMSGGVTRIVTQSVGSTLLNAAGTFSPFPGGDLLARFGYAESLDTLTNTRFRNWGPGARWNIRRGWYLDVSYTISNTQAQLVTSDSRVFFADLVITYR